MPNCNIGERGLSIEERDMLNSQLLALCCESTQRITFYPLPLLL